MQTLGCAVEDEATAVLADPITGDVLRAFESHQPWSFVRHQDGPSAEQWLHQLVFCLDLSLRQFRGEFPSLEQSLDQWHICNDAGPLLARAGRLLALHKPLDAVGAAFRMSRALGHACSVVEHQRQAHSTAATDQAELASCLPTDLRPKLNKTLSVSVPVGGAGNQFFLATGVGDFRIGPTEKAAIHTATGLSCRRLKNMTINPPAFVPLSRLGIIAGLVGPFVRTAFEHSLRQIWYLANSHVPDDHPIAIKVTPWETLIVTKVVFERVLAWHCATHNVEFIVIDATR